MTAPHRTAPQATPPLWTAAEAAEAAAARAVGDWAVTGVSIDTRDLGPGDLFVALRGDARDGHAFVADALAKGAGAALVSRVPEGVAPDAPLLVADDTLRALERLGAAARARAERESGLRAIGVTGSVGKTGAKEMLRAMLAPQGPAHASEKSYNNHWGVPLTLARMPRTTRWAAIEMGMNHAGEIAPLSRLSRPQVAMITTVEAVHIENFADESGIADAKSEIFEGLEPGGVAVLNRDNRWFDRCAAAARARGARVVSFGADSAADARLVSCDLTADASVARAVIGGAEIAFKIAAPGRHLAMNALGALAAAEAAGADLARCALGLAQWRAPEGRGVRWVVTFGDPEGEILVIDESYNANPASVGAALDVLAATAVEDGVGRFARGRRIAVLGDMLELGVHEAAMHAGLAEHPALGAVDLVHCVGPRMKALHEALKPSKRGEWFADSAAAAPRIRRLADAGDVFMVKGSRGARMERVVEALKAAGAARDAARPSEDA